MSLTVHVRIFVPGDNTPSESAGHVDMIIQGNHTFQGVELTNPVLSYRSNPLLQVFEEAASSNYYNTSEGKYYHDCSIYKWTFDLPTDNYSTFISELDNTIESYAPLGNSGKAFEGTIVSTNPFSQYDITQYNCFHAVAVWLDTLGNFTLSAIYHGAHDYAYLDYSPANMAEKNAQYWTPYKPEE